MRPEFVIFDMDDVLCHYEVGRRLRKLAAMSGATARDVRAAVWDSDFEDQVDAGGYPDSDSYLTEFGLRLGYPISRAEWIDARRDAMSPKQDVIAFAEALSHQAEMAIYTNNGPMVKEHFRDLLPEIAPIFQNLYCSYEFGTKKPDPASYSRLLESLGRRPDTCWFIDDKKSNVEGALIAGLKGHHFRNVELLRQDAEALGFTF